MVLIHPGQAYEARLSAGPPAIANHPVSATKNGRAGVWPHTAVLCAGFVADDQSVTSPIWLVSRIQASWSPMIKPGLPPSGAEYATGSEAVKRTQI